VSAVRPLVPESWGQLVYDGTWHYIAFEELSLAGTPDAYIALCRRRLFADEVILSDESGGPHGSCQQCLDEVLTKAATLAGAVHPDVADVDSSRPPADVGL
jgi:hypothetical protein